MRFSILPLLALLPITVLATPQSGVGKACTLASGTKGTCKLTSACTGSYAPTAGRCPGPKNVQCCTPKKKAPSGTGKACKVSGVAGTCKLTSACTGSYESTPGFCPGAKNVQCCTKKGSTGGGKGSLPGLNKKQSGYAKIIAQQAKKYGVGVRGCQVAIATAMQESTLRVLANKSVAGSTRVPHDGFGRDHDSVGIFQQRPKFWCKGKVADCMNPAPSAGKFFAALKRVKGWKNMSITRAAQAVQRSAYPNAYAKWESLAKKVCAAAY